MARKKHKAATKQTAEISAVCGVEGARITVKRTKDPAGLLPDHIEVTANGDGHAEDNEAELHAVLHALAELFNRDTIRSRIDDLRRHSQLVPVADEIQAIAETKWAAGCRPLEDDWELRARVAEAEIAALYFAAEIPATRDKKRQRGTSKGGDESGKARAEDAAGWHDEAKKLAHQMIADGGKLPHQVTSIVATRVKRSADQVRKVLQGAGILSKRKSRTK